MTWRRITTLSVPDSLTLDEVKDYLRINFSDDDSFITTLIAVSLEWVNTYTQRPILATDYSDEYGEFDTVPVQILVRETEAPLSKPTVSYTNNLSVETPYPPGDIKYDYCPVMRTITLDFDNRPDIQAESFIKVNWSVAAVAPDEARQSRLLVIANWYENREAVVTGSTSELQFGVKALLSGKSLVI